MTMQHTFGPWNLDMGKYRAAISNGGTIAKIDDTMTDWKTNACLIAAAPDLLHALELARDHLEVSNHEGEEDETLALINAAITKAKGA